MVEHTLDGPDGQNSSFRARIDNAVSADAEQLLLVVRVEDQGDGPRGLWRVPWLSARERKEPAASEAGTPPTPAAKPEAKPAAAPEAKDE